MTSQSLIEKTAFDKAVNDFIKEQLTVDLPWSMHLRNFLDNYQSIIRQHEAEQVTKIPENVTKGNLSNENGDSCNQGSEISDTTLKARAYEDVAEMIEPYCSKDGGLCESVLDSLSILLKHWDKRNSLKREQPEVKYADEGLKKMLDKEEERRAKRRKK